MFLAPNAAGSTLLDSAVGSYFGTGTIVVGPSATSHQVTCSFSATKWGRDALGLRGNCRAYIVLTRTVSADLVLDPTAGTISGTYTGARVGTARLSGKARWSIMDMVITWPAPVYGDTTASMRIVQVDPDRLQIIVVDRIGADGPLRATTDLSLTRRSR